MGYYAYKQVRDLLPQHIIDKQGPDYQGDPGYDGDQWSAAADYILELKSSLAAFKEENSRLRLLLNRGGSQVERGDTGSSRDGSNPSGLRHYASGKETGE